MMFMLDWGPKRTLNGGFLKWGVPQNGCFIHNRKSWKILWKWMMNRGNPYFRKPPNKEHHGLGGPTLKKNKRANFPHDLQMWNIPMNWSIILLEGSYHILEDVSLVCRGSLFSHVHPLNEQTCGSIWADLSREVSFLQVTASSNLSHFPDKCQ
jgi:hypothetical protein